MSDTYQENSEPLALSSIQTRVVVALAQGCSVSAAAETAGVHRATIHRWLQDLAFDSAVKQTRDDFIETLGDDFKTLTGLALTKLRMLLESPKTPPAVAARVSLAILNRSQFPKNGWELAAMDELESGEEDDESDDATLEHSVESVAK